MNQKLITSSLFFLLAACLMAGCGYRAKIVPVSGKVLLSGTPIVDCRVIFQPTMKNEIIGASGLTDAEGKFQLKTLETRQRIGAVPGEYLVKFSWRDPENDGAIRRPPYVIPQKYQSEGIVVEITSGSKMDFDLVP